MQGEGVGCVSLNSPSWTQNNDLPAPTSGGLGLHMWTTVTSFTVLLTVQNSLSIPLWKPRVIMPLNQAMVEVERFWEDFTTPPDDS